MLYLRARVPPHTHDNNNDDVGVTSSVHSVLSLPVSTHSHAAHGHWHDHGQRHMASAMTTVTPGQSTLAVHATGQGWMGGVDTLRCTV